MARVRTFATLRMFSTTKNVGEVSDLPGIQSAVARLRQEGCLMDVFCYFEIAEQGGPSLTSSQMRILAELGLGIVWDIYAS
jgi:hypothetical protein